MYKKGKNNLYIRIHGASLVHTKLLTAFLHTGTYVYRKQAYLYKIEHGNTRIGLRWRDTAVALTADVDVRQYLAAGDDVNLLGHSLQVLQDQSDAVRGVDNGGLRGVQLSRRTLNLL